MTTIRMETERVDGVARQLEQVNAAISQEMEILGNRIHSLNWQGAGADQFRAEFNALLRQASDICEEGILLSQRVKREAQEWVAADSLGASRFRDLKRALENLNLVMVGGGGVILASAQILGISTNVNGEYLQEYRKMSWKDKFKIEKNIQDELSSTQKQLSDMKPADELQTEINAIDAEIAELERKKAEAQKKADALLNKVIPDWPLERDSDGVPWRVRTDDYEDEVAEYDHQIQELQSRKQALQGDLSSRPQLETHLAELRQQQNALNQVIREGVPPDGPTTPKWLHNQLAGCTNYVAENRNVSGFGGGHPGDASDWNNQAVKAGYEVGERPAKGAIMVFEGDNNVMRVDKDAGHVAYVEKVEKVDGGYKVSVSQANTKYDSKGNFVRGTYVNKRSSTIFVKDGAKGVSFIYGKP